MRLNRVWPISRTRAEVTREFAIQSLAIILKLRLSHSPADETLVCVHNARLVVKVDLSFSSLYPSDIFPFVRNRICSLLVKSLCVCGVKMRILKGILMRIFKFTKDEIYFEII